MEKKNILKIKEQLSLFEAVKTPANIEVPYLNRLEKLLKNDLNFHNQVSIYSSHNFHSFPAKFPPQLPKLFIEELTVPNEVVLDPMVGSGTTVLEAYLSGRKAIGFDIDPLALKISKVKTTPLDRKTLIEYGREIYTEAKIRIGRNPEKLLKTFREKLDLKTKEFIDYWFLPEVEVELIALWQQISKLKDEKYKNFFEVVFSSIIITKSGGVSMALDLGHTRPHRAKAILNKAGEVIWGDKNYDVSKRNSITKIYRSPLEEFEKRFYQNLKGFIDRNDNRMKPEITHCDSQRLCLSERSVDLIITSPPYASNAIDYMRAHKFSLVWMGYNVEELTRKRRKYIGSEATTNYVFEDLPDFTSRKIEEISAVSKNRGNVLRRYYSEMVRTLKEMYRVLKHRKAAIVVVGNSVMKGIDTETHKCLEEIGRDIGFIVPHIGVRKLDRNKRMLPTGLTTDLNSQIQQRMHEEFVIGFYKP